MALSKNAYERIGQIEHTDCHISIKPSRILETCKISYKGAISVEIISHFLGGQNMEYNVTELENSFDCFNYCRRDMLDNIKREKRELLYFEDRNSTTSNIIVAVVKEPRSKHSREHLVFLCVTRLTIMTEPKTAYTRYFDITGTKLIYIPYFISCTIWSLIDQV